MALGSCKIRSPWLALCFAGLLLLISAGTPCDARRRLSSESDNNHHRKLDIKVVLLAMLTLLVALALLKQCCRYVSPVGHAAEEALGRSMEFSKKLFSAFAFVVVQRVLEEDDPKSIPPTMVRSPCDSPEPRHWARHVSLSSPVVRHHHSPRLSEPSGSGQQNPAAATDSCLRDIAPVCQRSLKEFSYLSLAKATRDFKRGNEFRSGVLYAGYLLFDDGLIKEVAIKRFHKNITDSSEQIRQDLRRNKYMLQHRNLVTLFGYCLQDGKLYLVYDWMRYHSLDYELFAEKDSSPHTALTLAQRHSIIKDAARGLLQLHDRNAFHGAVKASNVMLEPSSSGFRGRLADFRYSTVLAEHQGTTLESLLFPESMLSAAAADNSGAAGGPSLETDVLHFGRMMLEVLCGRRLFACEQLPVDYSSLLDWVQDLHGEARLEEALDEDAKKAPDFDKAQAELLLKLSLECSSPDPTQRPTIRTVLAELCKEVQTEIAPKHVRIASYH